MLHSASDDNSLKSDLRKSYLPCVFENTNNYDTEFIRISIFLQKKYCQRGCMLKLT